ncbi:MAG TPA: GDSL-type esterase/lipase family protein [Dokdonella sp.]
MMSPHVFHRCLLPLAAVFAAAAMQAATAGTPFVGTWSVSPYAQAASFDQQTLRQIVHTSIGGATARIHLSNVFGNAPLRIADVHVALRDHDAAIVVSTDVAVTFAGAAEVTIAAGTDIVSDPIPFAVPPRADVAVSIHLPDPTGAATGHGFALQTNYIAQGDVSAAADLADAQQVRSYYFLSGLDVQNPQVTAAVVLLGASITDGYGSTPDSNRRWSNRLAENLAAAGVGIGVLNQGISGNRLLFDGNGPNAVARFERDVLDQPGVRWVIFSDDPINDLGNDDPLPQARELIVAVEHLIGRAHARGIRFICSTLTPFEGADYWTPQAEPVREAFNDFVRSPGNGCDGIVDQDLATHDPARPTWYLPAYDAGDHLHPNDDGHAAIAAAIDPARFAEDIADAIFADGFDGAAAR